MFKMAWFMSWALAVTTAAFALIAFRASGDRSPFAMANWFVIVSSLAASPFFLWEIQSIPAVDSKEARNRFVRVSILIYLPLSSALALLAFHWR
jgi:hypothetical protein